MKRTTVTQRLMAVLLVPLIGMTMLTWLRVGTASADLRDATSQKADAIAVLGPANLLIALTDERNQQSLRIVGLSPTDLAQTSGVSPDNAIVATHKQLEVARSDTALGSNTRQTVAGIGSDLTYIRDAASPLKGGDFEGARTIFDEYSGLIAKVQLIVTAQASNLDDGELRRRALSVADQVLVTDLDARLIRMAYLDAALRPTSDSSVDADAAHAAYDTAEYRSEAGQLLALWEEKQDDAIALLATAPRARRVVSAYLTRGNQNQFKSELQGFSTGQIDMDFGYVDGLIKMINSPTGTTAVTALAATQDAIAARAESMRAAAQSQRNQAIAIFFATLVGSALIALFAARSLGRPLARLAHDARVLTDERLPDSVAGILATPPTATVVVPEPHPLPHSGVKEVDEVIDSLNGLELGAVDLAVGQVQQRNNSMSSLVNVARRVQGLVGRQLELLAKVEKAGQAGEANETVLKIDQVATRIRRNADSLILLAGGERKRHVQAGESVPLQAVMGAAIAEVEQYERVDMAHMAAAVVSASLSTDLSHLVSELIENALSFSAPTDPVELSGTGLADGGYEIHVADSGIGMTPEAIAQANDRLSGAAVFGTAPAKYLGHYVVGALAARHGLVVNLAANEAGGITGTIRIPRGLVSVVADGVDADGNDESTRHALSLKGFIDNRRSFDALMR